MPLSEEEQKQLEEIERNFYDSDPVLAKTVRTAMVADRTPRPALLGVVGMLGGLVLVIVGLSHQVALSYVGFLAIIAGALSLEKQIRRLAGAAVGAVTTRLTESQSHGPHRRMPPRPEDRRRRGEHDD